MLASSTIFICLTHACFQLPIQVYVSGLELLWPQDLSSSSNEWPICLHSVWSHTLTLSALVPQTPATLPFHFPKPAKPHSSLRPLCELCPLPNVPIPDPLERVPRDSSDVVRKSLFQRCLPLTQLTCASICFSPSKQTIILTFCSGKPISHKFEFHKSRCCWTAHSLDHRTGI